MAHARRLGQRRQSRPGPLIQQPQTRPHQDPVLPGQGHNVCQGAQRHQIAVPVQHLLGVPLQGAHQLESHPHAGSNPYIGCRQSAR